MNARALRTPAIRPRLLTLWCATSHAGVRPGTSKLKVALKAKLAALTGAVVAAANAARSQRRDIGGGEAEGLVRKRTIAAPDGCGQ
jgi:hypothetical protein